MKRYCLVYWFEGAALGVIEESDDVQKLVSSVAHSMKSLKLEGNHCLAMIKDRFSFPTEFVEAFISDRTAALVERIQAQKEVAL